eukprot:6462071-Amphidinium_carterae.1
MAIGSGYAAKYHKTTLAAATSAYAEAWSGWVAEYPDNCKEAAGYKPTLTPSWLKKSSGPASPAGATGQATANRHGQANLDF